MASPPPRGFPPTRPGASGSVICWQSCKRGHRNQRRISIIAGSAVIRTGAAAAITGLFRVVNSFGGTTRQDPPAALGPLPPVSPQVTESKAGLLRHYSRYPARAALLHLWPASLWPLPLTITTITLQNYSVHQELRVCVCVCVCTSATASNKLSVVAVATTGKCCFVLLVTVFKVRCCAV